MTLNTLQVSDYDPFRAEVMIDPYPFYKVLRRDDPIHYMEKYDAFFFSRFEDNLELLDHIDNSFLQSEGSLPPPEDLTERNAGAPALPTAESFTHSQKLGMPIYGEMRRAHVKPMMPRGAEGMREFVTRLANERLDILIPRGRFNLIRDYGGIVSASVLCSLMGMPLDLAGQALDAVNTGSRTDPVRGGVEPGLATRLSVELYRPYVQARMDAGADGSVPMVDGLINYRLNGRALTLDEVAQGLVCAFIGGIETVPKVAGQGLLELARHPDQMAQVRADPARNVPKAAEEMIRYCAPAQWFIRTAHRPITVAGQKIEPGQRVFFMVASALRDEREFENPDEFVWDRMIPRVLSFGHGMHYCIGVHLARMEVQVLVDTFLRRVPDFSLAMFDMDAAVRRPSSFQLSWNDLPITIA